MHKLQYHGVENRLVGIYRLADCIWYSLVRKTHAQHACDLIYSKQIKRMHSITGAVSRGSAWRLGHPMRRLY